MPPTILVSLLAWPQLHCLVLVLEVVVADVDVDVVSGGKDVVVVDAIIVKHRYLIYLLLILFLILHVTSDVTLTEQQTIARNPLAVFSGFVWNLSVILVPVLVKGPGKVEPQYHCVEDPSLISM